MRNYPQSNQGMAETKVPNTETMNAEHGWPRGGKSETTILVVDDEPALLRMSERILRRAQYRVLVAESGSEALEMFAAQADAIGIVLLDVSMVGMTGRETFEAIKALRPDVPIVLSSGYSVSPGDRIFDGLSYSGFVAKPYSLRTLVDALEGALR